MARMILMCAPAFAGKTQLSRAIAQTLLCPRVSLDEINEERGLDGGQGVPAEEWEKTSWISVERVHGHLGRGDDVVVDDTNCFRFLRDRYRDVAMQEEAEFLLVYLAVPLEELRRRITANRSSGKRNDIADEVFESHYNSFEIPTEDEEALVFKPEDEVESWIRKHLLRAGG